MNKKIFSQTTLWLVIFGLLKSVCFRPLDGGRGSLGGPIFGMRYLHTYPQRRKYLFFYLVLWLTLAIPWYGATPIFGLAHFIFMAVEYLVRHDPLLPGFLAWHRSCDATAVFLSSPPSFIP